MTTSARCTPIQADFGWMDPMLARDCADCRILKRRCIGLDTISLWPGWRPERREANWLNLLFQQIFQELQLLKVRMQFHFIACGAHTDILKKKFELRNRYVRGSDIACQTHFQQLFHFAPGFDELRMIVRTRVLAS